MDAAMSGGATGADSGELTLMIGGDEDVFDKHRDLLGSIAKNIYYLGESGAGHAMKLIHNMVVHTIFLTNCEAGRLAESAGISLKDMIDVFNNSNARSYSSEFRFPKHILSEKWDARSRVYNLNKDLGMAVRMADSMGVKAHYTNQTYNFLEKAINMGMSEEDYSLLYPQFDTIRDSLTDSGMAALQVITIDEKKSKDYQNRPDFIQQYIFPGGMLPTKKQFEYSAKHVGLKCIENLSFGGSYAKTLKMWNKQFQKSWNDLSKFGFDIKFKRMWEFYFSYCETGFSNSSTDVSHFLIQK